jgi:hypothetical protein
MNGCLWWKWASPFRIAHADIYNKERTQIGLWLAELKYGSRNSQVFEFSAKSFWSGYWTYRLMDLDRCWAVAKFKYQNSKRLVEFRIQKPGDVTAKEQENGKLRIEIAGRSIPDVEAPLEFRNRLLCAVRKNLDYQTR